MDMIEFKAEYANIRTNRNTTIHLGYRFGDNGRFTPMCGSGENNLSTRRRSNHIVTKDAVTCKKCLKRIEEKNTIKDFFLRNTAPLSE